MPQLKEIIDYLSPAQFIGNAECEVRELVRLDPAIAKPDSLFWCRDKKLASLDTLPCGTVLCSSAVLAGSLNPEINYIVVNNPRLAYLKVAGRFFPEPEEDVGIHASASVHPSTTFGQGVRIGHNVVIEKECVVGDGTSIGPNTVIHRRTIIGSNVRIGANNTIGGVGFGYERNDEGVHENIPHLGNVVIEDNVEIGNNSAIDRAALGSTLIQAHAKIDNLVHIAHGVSIGRNSLVIAHAMIGGSTVIGSDVWVAPTAALINGIAVGDESVIGMGAVVTKPVTRGDVVVGNPGRVLRNKFSQS